MPLLGGAADLELVRASDGSWQARAPGSVITIAEERRFTTCLGCMQHGQTTSVTRVDVRRVVPLDEVLVLRHWQDAGPLRGVLPTPTLPDWILAWYDDPARFASLVAAGAFDRLGELSPSDVCELVVDPASVRVTTAGPARGRLLVEALVRWAEGLAQDLRRASRRLPPPPWRTALEAGWTEAAGDLGGTYDAHGRVLYGSSFGRRYRLFAAPGEGLPGTWWTTCEAEVPGAAPGDGGDVVWTWRRGDPPLDLVALRRAPCPRMREVLGSADRVELRTETLAVSVARLVTEPPHVTDMVLDCVGAVLELASDPQGPGPGPYR